LLAKVSHLETTKGTRKCQAVPGLYMGPVEKLGFIPDCEIDKNAAPLQYFSKFETQGRLNFIFLALISESKA